MVEFEKKKAEESKSHVIISRIINIAIIPVLLISALSIYIFSQTKLNSGIPSGFGYHVINVQVDNGDFEAGDMVLVASVSDQAINNGDYVAYYVATENPGEQGSEIAFKVVLNVQTNESGKKEFQFDQETYLIIEDAIIGVHTVSSVSTYTPFFIMLLNFFGNDLIVILVGLLPLFTLLVLLGFNIVEEYNLEKTNKEIEQALIKAGQAGFETNFETSKKPQPKEKPIAKPEIKPEEMEILSKIEMVRTQQGKSPVAPKAPFNRPTPPVAPKLPVAPRAGQPKPPVPPKPPVLPPRK